jgi:hypothetical protein
MNWWRKFSAWFGNLLYRDEMRYMVRAIDGEGKDFVVGWSTLRSGGTPMRLVKEHPLWHSPIVIDTKEGVLGKGSQREWDDGHGDSWPPTY